MSAPTASGDPVGSQCHCHATSQPHPGADGNAAAKPGLVELRTAVIIQTSFICGATIGLLTFLATVNVATAVLAGVLATGGSLAALNALIR